jgi:hypothetical protein
MTATVTNLGALPGEVVLSGGVAPARDDVLVTSKGNVTVRVASLLPFGALFLSYEGPALAVGDTVEVGDDD